MGQVEEGPEPRRLAFYSHISRIYNSSVNAAIAVIFGWLAFVGFCLTIEQQTFSMIRPALISIGLVMFTFGGYFYFRIWIHGRYLAVMFQDFGLGNLEDRLRTVNPLARLNWRPVERPTDWTHGERIGLAFLVGSFVIPIMGLLLR